MSDANINARIDQLASKLRSVTIEVLFVNHGNPYGDFGPLAGRFKRAK